MNKVLHQTATISGILLAAEVDLRSPGASRVMTSDLFSITTCNKPGEGETNFRNREKHQSSGLFTGSSAGYFGSSKLRIKSPPLRPLSPPPDATAINSSPLIVYTEGEPKTRIMDFSVAVMQALQRSDNGPKIMC